MGSANLDLVVVPDRLPGPGETVKSDRLDRFPGGKGLNQAVAAHLASAPTVFCAALGQDAAGAEILAAMASVGLSAEHVVRSSTAPTGTALITVSAAAENQIVVVPGANNALAPAHVVPAASRARVLLTQLEVPVPTGAGARAAAREAGATTVLNPAPAVALPSGVLALADYIVPNEHEAAVLGGPHRLLGHGARAVIVTRGGAGVDVHRRGHAPLTVPAFPVDVTDTTAAGAAICGAFVAALARGAELLAAVRFGCAAGALATTARGAVPSLPRRDRIDSLLRTAAPLD